MRRVALKVSFRHIFFLVSMTWCFALYGQDFSLSWNLGTSLTWGRAEEIVYKNANQPEKLSLLIWNLPLIQTLKLDLKANLPLGFLVRASSQLGFPYGQTTMTDWDWINISDQEDPEIFSDSTSFLVGWFRFNADLGWGIAITPQTKTEIFLSYLYLFSSWEGWNSVQGQKHVPGTTTYYGHTIDFRQVWHGLALGSEVSYQLSTVVLVSSLFRFYPWVGYFSRDIHILTSKTYYDTASTGLGLEFIARLIWQPTAKFLVRFGYEASWLWSNYGDSLTSNNGSTNSNSAFFLAKGVIGGIYHSMGVSLDFGFVLD